jgi:hypothetical protein
MVTANLKFEVSGQSLSTTNAHVWLANRLSNRSGVNTTNAHVWLANRLGTSETQIVHPLYLYSATGKYTRYTKPYGTTAVDQRKGKLWITRTVIICPPCENKWKYLPDKFVCVFVSLLLLVLQSAFYAGSGKVYLENAASRIHCENQPKTSVTNLGPTPLMGYEWPRTWSSKCRQGVPPTLTFDWLIDSSNRSKCHHHAHVWLANRLVLLKHR